MFQPELKKIVNGCLVQPKSAGEWTVLIQRLDKEFSYREAALYLNMKPEWVCRLSSPRKNVLKRTRRGFVSTASVKKLAEKKGYNG